MIKKQPKNMQTLNGCLPLEQGSVWHETFTNRVSDHSRHFIFDLSPESFDFQTFEKNKTLRKQCNKCANSYQQTQNPDQIQTNSNLLVTFLAKTFPSGPGAQQL